MRQQQAGIIIGTSNSPMDIFSLTSFFINFGASPLSVTRRGIAPKTGSVEGQGGEVTSLRNHYLFHSVDAFHAVGSILNAAKSRSIRNLALRWIEEHRVTSIKAQHDDKSPTVGCRKRITQIAHNFYPLRSVFQVHRPSHHLRVSAGPRVERLRIC